MKKETELTQTEKDKLIKLEQQMRDSAYAIANINEEMKNINYNASQKSMQGIIDYLIEKKG